MKRRTVLSTGGIAVSSIFAGCIDDLGSDDRDSNTGSDDENDGGIDFENRAKECEKRYIRTEVMTRDGETIDDPLQPAVTDSDSRDDGEFIALRTEFGVTRESEEGPDEHLDYRVTAYYFISDETVYRTEGEEAGGDPRDGIEMDC